MKTASNSPPTTSKASSRSTSSWQNLPREQVIHEYAILRKAANIAQNKGLNQKSPYEEAIDFQVMFTLANAWAQDAAGAIKVDQAEVEKYYNDNKEPFKQIKVSRHQDRLRRLRSGARCRPGAGQQAG